MALGDDTTLRVIGPTGISGLVSYLLVQERTLFTGSPADDLSALNAHGSERPEWIAPGQGFLVAVS